MQSVAVVRFNPRARINTSRIRTSRGSRGGGGLGGLGGGFGGRRRRGRGGFGGPGGGLGGLVLGQATRSASRRGGCGGFALVGLLLLGFLLFQAFAGGGTSFSPGPVPGTGGGTSPDLAEECVTGQDANERQDCRLAAFADTVDGYWSQVLSGYRPPTVDLFEGAVPSACGGARPEIGPHYCPADETIYVELAFFEVLEDRFGAQGGDFAEAYVLAHEYGHHVQNLLGDLDRAQSDPAGPESGAVRVELQADCYAGAWAAAAEDDELILDVSDEDVREAVDAAAAVGDDRIQERAQGRGRRRPSATARPSSASAGS